MQKKIQKNSRYFLPFFLSIYAVYGAILIFRSSFLLEGTRYFVLFDDMMISMRYAKHLAQGHGLVWNINGPLVEGFSNPMWTIYMSFLHLLPHNPPTISLYIQISALIIMVLNLFFVWKILNFLTKERKLIFLGMLITALYFPLNSWSIVHGTEVSIITLIVTATTYLSLKSIKREKVIILLYFLLGVATLFRVDAIVPAIITITFLTLVIKKQSKEFISRNHNCWRFCFYPGSA